MELTRFISDVDSPQYGGTSGHQANERYILRAKGGPYVTAEKPQMAPHGSFGLGFRSLGSRVWDLRSRSLGRGFKVNEELPHNLSRPFLLLIKLLRVCS